VAIQLRDDFLGRHGAHFEHLDRVVHVGVDAQLARDLERLLDDVARASSVFSSSARPRPARSRRPSRWRRCRARARARRRCR
jgi:hypothetical protein